MFTQLQDYLKFIFNTVLDDLCNSPLWLQYSFLFLLALTLFLSLHSVFYTFFRERKLKKIQKSIDQYPHFAKMTGLLLENLGNASDLTPEAFALLVSSAGKTSDSLRKAGDFDYLLTCTAMSKNLDQLFAFIKALLQKLQAARAHNLDLTKQLEASHRENIRLSEEVNHLREVVETIKYLSSLCESISKKVGLDKRDLPVAVTTPTSNPILTVDQLSDPSNQLPDA